MEKTQPENHLPDARKSRAGSRSDFFLRGPGWFQLEGDGRSPSWEAEGGMYDWHVFVSHMFSIWEYRYSYGICFGTVYALQNSTPNISTPNILSCFFPSTPVGLKSGIFYVGDHDCIYIYICVCVCVSAYSSVPFPCLSWITIGNIGHTVAWYAWHNQQANLGDLMDPARLPLTFASS